MSRSLHSHSVLRVHVDSVGYIGPVEVTPTTTLAELRRIIATSFDAESIPLYYVFLGKGSTVGSDKESSLLASEFRPGITLLPTDESPIAVSVSVRLWTGATFCMWALPSCTVHQLRTEASRFWRLNPADTVLSTEDAALWPDSALVHACLSVPAAGAWAGGVSGEGRGAGGGTDGRSDSQSGPTSPLATPVATPSVKGPNAPRSFSSAIHFYLHLRDSSLEKLLDSSSFPSSLPLTSEQGGGMPRQRTRGLSGDGRRSIVGSPGRPGGGRVSIAAGAGGGADSSFIDDFGEAGGEDNGGEMSSRASRSHSRRVRHSVAGSHAGASSMGGGGSLPHVAEHAAAHAAGAQRRISGKRAREEETPISLLFRHMARGLPTSQYSALLPLVGQEDGLWRVFTWYGTQGDARDPFHIRSRQWRRLLHDCGLLQGSDAAAPGLVQQMSWERADVLFSACQATSRRGAVHVSHGGTLNTPMGGGLGATMDSGAADFGSPTEDGAGAGQEGDSIIPSMATLAARLAREGGSHGSTKHERATTGLDYITFMRALVAVAVYCCTGQSTDDGIPPVPLLHITGCRHGDALHALSVILSSPTAGLLTLAPALARLDSGKAVKADPPTSSPWMPSTSGAMVGGAALPSRTLDTGRVQALVTLLGDIILPRADCWPLARWRQEGRVLGMDSTALDALLQVGPARGARLQTGATAHEEEDVGAVQGTMLAELHRFVPALYLLFSYYCDAPSARVVSVGLPPSQAQAGAAHEERGYTAIHAARQRSAEPPHREAGHAAQEPAAQQEHEGVEERAQQQEEEEGIGARETGKEEEEEAVRRHDTGSVRSGATKASAMNQYMEQLRQAAAEERARAYNRASSAEPSDSTTSNNTNASSKAGGLKASSKAASRLDMQSQGFSPNSVLAGNGGKLQAVARGGRAGRGGYAAARVGVAAGKDQSGKRPNTRDVKVRTAPVSQALQGNIAVTAAAVRAVPLPPPLAPSPSASPSRHTPSSPSTAVLADEEASVSYDSFLKFCSECGLTDFSSLGNIPPLPARQVTEVFLASACLGVGEALGRMAAAATKGKGRQQGGSEAAFSAVANGVPDPYTDRLRLGWPQFLSCLCRLALTLGQHILALPQKELFAGEAYNDVGTALLEQVSLSVSLAAVSPILRLRALMQVLSIGLSQAQRLGPLLTARRDTLSASSDKLLRGIQAFHIAYSSLGKDIGGCVDHGMLLVAYSHAAVGTGVLQRAHAALLGHLLARGQRKKAATESKEDSLREEEDGTGGGMGEDAVAAGGQGEGEEAEEGVEYAAKAAWLVEGKGQGHRTGGMMQVSAARGSSKSPGKRKQAARRRVMQPPVFASDLVRFAGLSQPEAVALAAAVAAGRKASAMGGQSDSVDDEHAAQEADVSMLPTTTHTPTPAHALTVRVSALAALDTVWKEQQEIKASTGKLLQARQQDAKAASQAISQQRLLARLAMSERRSAAALPTTGTGPGPGPVLGLAGQGQDVHATAPSTSAMLQQTEEYAAYVRESELERRRAVWSELQRARVEVASAVQAAMTRQQMARRGLMPPSTLDPHTEQQQQQQQHQQSEEQRAQAQAQAFAVGAQEFHTADRMGAAGGAGGALTRAGGGGGGSKDSGRSGSGSPHRTASPDPFVRMGSYPRSASMASLDRLLQHHGGATSAGAGVAVGTGQGHRGVEFGSGSSGDHTESHGLPPLGSFLSLAGGRRQPGHSPLPSPALSPPPTGLLLSTQGPLAPGAATDAHALASAIEGGTEEDDTAGDSGSYSSRSGSGGGQGGRGGVPTHLADPAPPPAAPTKGQPGGGPTLHAQHSEDTPATAHTFGRDTLSSSRGFLSSSTTGGSLSTLGSPTIHTQPPSASLATAAAAASAAHPHPHSHPHQASGASADRVVADVAAGGGAAATAQATAGSVPPLQKQVSATVSQVPAGSGQPSHTPAQHGGTGGSASGSSSGGGHPAASERHENGGSAGGQAQGGGRARSGAIDASARDRPVKPVSTPPQQSQAGAGGSRARDASPDAPAGRQAETSSKPGEVSGAPPGRPQSLKSVLAPAAPSSSTTAQAGVVERGQQGANTPSPPKPAGPASDPRARDIVERRLKWKRMLLEGAVFMKFGRWGKPHPRVVWLDGDCEAVRWRKVDSTAGPRDARTEVIVVADISEVLEGPSTSVFSRNSKSITNPACCFSVVTPARTLDLMAESKEQKEDWVTALLALKKYKSFI